MIKVLVRRKLELAKQKALAEAEVRAHYDAVYKQAVKELEQYGL